MRARNGRRRYKDLEKELAELEKTEKQILDNARLRSQPLPGKKP